MSEWKSSPLRQITSIRVSSVDKKIYSNKSLVRLCNYMNVYTKAYITNQDTFQVGSADSNEISHFSLQAGDVLITKDSETPDDIGIPAIVTENIDNLVCGYHLAILRPYPSALDGAFLMHQFGLPEIKNYFYQVANGSTRYGLTIADIENVSIHAPTSIAEQRKIARILSTVDDVIEKTEAAIAKYQSIKAGMMRDLFTRGIDPATGRLRPSHEEAPELYKKSELGWVPKEWEGTRLDKACIKIQDGTHFSPKSTIGPYMYVTSKNIRLGYLDLSNVGWISEQEHKGIYQRCNVKYGDILLTKDGANTGNVAFNSLHEEFSLLSSVALLRCDEISYHNMFLFHCLLSTTYQQKLTDLMSGNAITRITLTKINEILVPKPSYSEQCIIANKLTSVQMLYGQERLLLSKSKRLKQALMSDLLTGKVRVKYDE